MRGRCALIGVALLLSACGGGSGGAIVVRWRLIDGATGAPASGCDLRDCAADTSVHVDQMRLQIIDATSGREASCPSCSFACAQLERTTEFEIASGSYYLALQALSCGTPVGDPPPRVLREVYSGEATNLNAVGITIPPGTHSPLGCGGVPPCDGGR